MLSSLERPGANGLQNRFNNKYEDLGFNAIEPIYKTSSADHADEVEDMASQYGKLVFSEKVKNNRGGGGGPVGADPP